MNLMMTKFMIKVVCPWLILPFLLILFSFCFKTVPQKKFRDFLEPQFCYERGLARYRAGDYDGSIGILNKAIKLEPEFVVAYFLRAQAKDHLKDFEGANLDLNTIINLYPERNSYKYLLSGYSKSKLKDYKGALKDYNKLIKLEPYFEEVTFDIRKDLEAKITKQKNYK